jgi:hypothetical protein
MNPSPEKRKLSPEEEKKGCIGCLVILAIPAVLILVLYASSGDEATKINDKWYVGPKKEVQKVESLNENQQKQVARSVDAREASEPNRASSGPNRYGISLGTTSDDVLALRGKASQIVRSENDEYGMVVSWVYPDTTYVFGLRERNGITAYRVIQIK